MFREHFMKHMLAATLLASSAAIASAQPAMPMEHREPAGVLNLDARATADVPTDVVTMTLAVEQEGAEPGAISQALSQRAQRVIAEAKRTQGVSAESGGFTIYPSNDKNGRISAWRGRAEVRLESKDFAAVSKLAGDLASQMQVQNIAFSLSREARAAVEGKLADEAIASFKNKAQQTAKAFGYGSYTIRTVHVGQAGAVTPMPRAYMAKGVMAAEAMSAPVPVEGGKAQVTVTVSGSVQMLR
jgi:predicted secreted protein